MFLPGTKCTSIGCRHDHTYYPSLSFTAKDQMQSFFLSYSSGNVQGDLYTDSVFVGGFEVRAYFLGALTSDRGVPSIGYCSDAGRRLENELQLLLQIFRGGRHSGFGI